MQVHIQNDGPVTIDLESPQFPPPKQVLFLLLYLYMHAHIFYSLLRGSLKVAE